MHAYHHNIKINLIKINLDECNQRLRYPTFAANSDRSNGNCITLCCLSDKIYVLSKIESLNSISFSMIKEISESKILRKNKSHDFKYKFDATKCNSN